MDDSDILVRLLCSLSHGSHDLLVDWSLPEAGIISDGLFSSPVMNNNLVFVLFYAHGSLLIVLEREASRSEL